MTENETTPLPSPPQPAAPAKAKASLGRRLLRWGLVLFAYLALCELFFQLFFSDPPLSEVVYGNHPIYHHVPKAFLEGGFGEYDFRRVKYENAPRPDTLRVAFIGDSFTYGFCPPNETIPFYFQRFLKERFPNQRIEVLNFGFVSYSPIIEEVVYKRLVAPLKPDYVILLYDTFDPQDDVLYTKSATFAEDGSADSVAGEQFFHTGLRRFATVRFAEFASTVIENDWDYFPFEQRFAARVIYVREPSRFQNVVNYSFSILKRLAARVERDGSRFMLFQYPPPHLLADRHEFTKYFAAWGLPVSWVPPRESPFTKQVLAFCRANGLRCFDFGPQVRAIEDALPPGASRLGIYNNEDGHFTGAVNKVFARFILDSFVAQGFGAKPQAEVTPASAPR